MSTAFTNPALLRRLQLLGQQAAPDDLIGQDGTVRRRMQLTAPPQDFAPVERVATPPQSESLAPVASSPVARISMPPQGDALAPVAPRAGVSAFLQPPRMGLDRSPSINLASSPPVINGTPARMMDRPPADVSGEANFSRITAPPQGDVDAARQTMQRGQGLRLTAPEDNDRQAMGQALDRTAPPDERVMNQTGNAAALQPPDERRAQYSQPDDQRAAYDMGPAQRRAMQLLADGPKHDDHHVGDGERFMHGLKLAGKLAIRTGANPVAVVGGLASGIADPQSYHDYNYEQDVRRALGPAQAEGVLRDRNLQAVEQYQKSTGRNYFDDTLTPEGAVKQAQIGNYYSEDERRKNQTANEAAKRGLDAFDSWAKYAAPGARVPDHIAKAAGMPQGSTVWHNQQTGQHYYKAPNGQKMQVIDGVARPVRDEKGDPAYEYTTPVREPQTPEYVYQGRARAELQREMGITNPNAMVDNPAFADAFEQKKAAEAQSSKQYGYPMPSDAEIAQQVGKKVPRKVKAGSQVTKEMVDQRAAELYQREQGNKKSVKPGTPVPQPSPKVLQQQAAVHERQYAQVYGTLNEDQRAEFERRFKAEYGRLPKRPH